MILMIWMILVIFMIWMIYPDFSQEEKIIDEKPPQVEFI